MSDTPTKQSWTEAVIECVSDSAERERLVRLYDYDELVKACLALGGLALTAKTESAKNAKLERELANAERKLAGIKEWETAMKASCVDKCAHEARLVIDYEDGTRHCAECEAMKGWDAERKLAEIEKVCNEEPIYTVTGHVEMLERILAIVRGEK